VNLRDLLASYNSGILRARQAYAVLLAELDANGGRANGCGTYAGYCTHQRHKTPPCDDCREAMAEYNRDRRAARKAVN
jgi:hypothetical protein